MCVSGEKQMFSLNVNAFIFEIYFPFFFRVFCHDNLIKDTVCQLHHSLCRMTNVSEITFCLSFVHGRKDQSPEHIQKKDETYGMGRGERKRERDGGSLCLKK